MPCGKDINQVVTYFTTFAINSGALLKAFRSTCVKYFESNCNTVPSEPLTEPKKVESTAELTDVLSFCKLKLQY